MTSLFIRIW